VTLTLPIRDVVHATPRARIVRIDLSGQPFPFDAGQALMISSRGAERKRTYSIASSPEDVVETGAIELLVGVNAEGSPGPHLVLEPHAFVDIDGPLGRFTFPAAPTEQRFVFVAGGTGISPLRSMLRHALHGRHEHIGLLYSARTPEEFAYESELRELARQGRIELKLKVTRETADRRWTGHRGRISSDDLAPLVHGRRTLCFVCGPRPMVDEIPKLLTGLGLAPERIRIEEW